MTRTPSSTAPSTCSCTRATSPRGCRPRCCAAPATNAFPAAVEYRAGHPGAPVAGQERSRPGGLEEPGAALAGFRPCDHRQPAAARRADGQRPGRQPAPGDPGADRVPRGERAGADGQHPGDDQPVAQTGVALYHRTYAVRPADPGFAEHAADSQRELPGQPVAGVHSHRYPPARCQPGRGHAVAARRQESRGDRLPRLAQASAGAAAGHRVA